MPLPVMLFTRTYHGMLGGHLKVFDYLRHAAASQLFEPVLYLSPESTMMPAQHLVPETIRIVREPIDAPAYFIAGLNWRMLDERGVNLSGKAIVNLIQGLRHAMPGDPRRAFLSRPAMRICVSRAVEQALRKTHLAAGEVITIPNGVDTEYLARFAVETKRPGVFIGGLKNPPVAQALASSLQNNGISVDLCVKLIPREEFLTRMALQKIAVLLPHPYEGFFLPALEAMAMGCVPVLPHCEGAAEFCIDGETCITVTGTPEALHGAVERILNDGERQAQIVRRASLKAAEHSLARECELFTGVLQRLGNPHK
jgi:glycosyltransferase involved in cell wall biosynthesis